jgi:solute carrier family 25 protein 16
MGLIDTLKYVYNKYGLVNGLYRGITLNYIRAVPMVSTSFCMYEVSRKYLGLETGQLIKSH